MERITVFQHLAPERGWLLLATLGGEVGEHAVGRTAAGGGLRSEQGDAVGQ